MDPSNGFGWFENIFQKLEGICHDVDEIMHQAESHLVTVGDSVKSFFSDLDLKRDELPQSSVEKKVEAPDSSLSQNTDVHVDKKSGEDSDNRAHNGSLTFVKSTSSGLLEVIDDAETNRFQFQTSEKKDSGDDREVGLDVGANILISASDDVGGCNSFMEMDERSRNLSLTITDDTRLSYAVNMDNLFKESAAGIATCPADTSAVSHCDGAANLTTSATELVRFESFSSSDGMEFPLLCSSDEGENGVANLTTSTTELVQLASFSSSDEKGFDLYYSSDESDSTSLFPECEERHNDVTKSDLQNVGSLDKLKLDESCILVDSTMLQCSSSEAVKPRSYKKKLKDAFASKMRLLKKQNNSELTMESFTAPMLSEKSNSLDYEFIGSDWEIV